MGHVRISYAIVAIFILGLLGMSQSVHAGTLVANRVNVGPKVDGLANDAAWTSTPEAVFTNGLKMKSVYDGSTLYVLATWPDETMSMTRGGSWTWNGSAWSIQPSTGQNEDRLALSWNINAPGFASQGCAVSCHSEGMWLTTAGERLDLWHGKAARGQGAINAAQSGAVTVNPTTHEATAGSVTLNGYVDDTYIGEDSGADRGRHADAGSGAYSNNRNTAQTGPLYIEVNPENYIDAMTLRKDEVDGGQVLVLASASASEISAAWAKYEALRAVVPEQILRAPAGSRGDVLQSVTWTNGVWVAEFSRALVTGKDDDVQFDNLSRKYHFSVAIFNNSGGISHDVSNLLHEMVFEQPPVSAGTAGKNRAVVVATVTNNGTPVAGAEVAFSRSLSGQPENFRWKGITDTNGRVTVEIVADEPQFWRIGATGYYVARTVGSGVQIGRWGSIPIQGGNEIAVSLPIGEPASIGTGKALAIALEAASPNPFNPSTQIGYRLPEAGDVTLTIYNTMGQQIKVLVNTQQDAGYHLAIWDGRDAYGRSVATGVYIYRLVSQGKMETRRMLLLK